MRAAHHHRGRLSRRDPSRLSPAVWCTGWPAYCWARWVSP